MNWLLVPLREGIVTILIVAGPIILVAAAAGLLIGILQAATSIQDQAIPNAIKLIGIMILLIVLGVWMFARLTTFTEKTIGQAFSMVISNRTPIGDDLGDKAKVQPPPSQFSQLQPPFKPFGQLTASDGNFQAKVAPPLQAFSNALQTSKPPTAYYPVSAPASPYPAPNFNQAPANNQFNYMPPNHPSGQAYPQTNAYSYNNTAQFPSQAAPMQNRPSDYMNNPYQPGYYPPNRPPQQYPPQYNPPATSSNASSMAYSAENQSELILPKQRTQVAAENKVILQSSSGAKQQPMKIIKPKLPSSEDDSTSQGDPLPPPSSGVTWW